MTKESKSPRANDNKIKPKKSDAPHKDLKVDEREIAREEHTNHFTNRAPGSKE